MCVPTTFVTEITDSDLPAELTSKPHVRLPKLRANSGSTSV
jgi:hypothetical protein